MSKNELFSKYLYLKEKLTLLMLCYLTTSGVFELILKQNSPKAQFGNQVRQHCSLQRGHIWTVTHVFFNKTLFYFIETL